MGRKKDAVLHGTSKKDRAKLEARAAEIAAELERREKKAAKKGGKKGKGKKSAEAVRDRSKPLSGKKLKAALEADTDAAKARRAAEIAAADAVTKARVQTKRAEREAAAAAHAIEKATEAVEMIDAGALGTMTIGPAIVYAKSAIADLGKGDDRHPALAHLDRVGELIAIANDKSAKPKKREKAAAELAALRAEGEARIAERDAKREADGAVLKEKVAAKRTARALAGEPDVKGARMPDALDGESEAEYQMRKLRERKEADAVAKTAEAVDALKSAVEIVETERGREFAVGASVAKDEPEEFGKPSESGPELEEGRNGYKIIQLVDGKPDPRRVRQMTRVTTFVGNIDDETMLRDWEKRLLAVGVSAGAEDFVPKINDITHRRDVAIEKAKRADRKGRLGIGEAGDLIAAAEKAWKYAMNALVDEALEAAGRNDKADAGTALHTLAEISDEKGIDAVREMHESGEITATALASIEAYAERMTRLAAKVIESEAVVVSDELGYAGRLDRIIMAKLPALRIKTVTGVIERPADRRARRYVTDIKSGRIDLGAGKISRQLAAYALGDLYDLETGERSRHSAARDIALVFHLPQGRGVCTVHAVDIKHGAALLKLSAEVRRARNTGRKTIDVTVDITDAEPEGDDEKAGAE